MIINGMGEGDVEKAQLQVADGVVHSAQPQGQAKVNEGVICDDPVTDFRFGCKRKGLIEGGSDPIPFFPSFLDNLGPRYWAGCSKQRSPMASEISPTHGQGQLRQRPSEKTDGDAVEKVLTLTATKPKIGNVLPAPDDGAPLLTPDSSRRGVQDLKMEDRESDELTSTYKPQTTRSNSTGDLLTDIIPSTSNNSVLRPPHAAVDANPKKGGVQFQRTPDRVSSTGSTSFGPAPPQSRKMSPRDLQGKQKELEGVRDGSSKRLRLETGLLLPVIESPILPNPSSRDDLDEIRVAFDVTPRDGFDEISDDFDVIWRAINAVQCKRAERRHRMRMLTLPDTSSSKRKEAMDKTIGSLRRWHFLLALDNPACPTVASHIFFRSFRKFQKSTWPMEMPEAPLRVRVLMAAAFWVTVKILDSVHKIPQASHMARAAGITARSLIQAELPLLDALQWKLVRY